MDSYYDSKDLPEFTDIGKEAPSCQRTFRFLRRKR